MSEPAPFTPFSDGERAIAGAFRMGLSPIAEADWLPLPPDLEARLAQRARVLEVHRARAFAEPPEALPAARELLALLGVDAADAARDPSPLSTAAARVPDDLCLLDAGAPPRLRAGVLTAPTNWRLDRRLGQDVRAIHGPVDGLDEAIGARMRDFLARLPAARIFERGNWALYDDDRYWHPEGPALGRISSALGAAPEVAGHLFLRCERQTLRRLPESRWILFTIRVHLMPVTDLARRPRLAGHLREAMDSLDPAEARARRLDHVGPGLRAWLDALRTGAEDRACAQAL